MNAITEFKDKLFPERLKGGIAYEKFVQIKLPEVLRMPFNANIPNFEKVTGIEIKLDTGIVIHRNLYIETSECRYATDIHRRPSGIYDYINSWLYVIGDYERFWVFGTNTLRMFHSSGVFHEVEKSTSTGFLIPVKTADLIALTKWIK